jgi:hypothetical protein
MRLQVKGMLSIFVSADGRSHRYIIKVSMVTACTKQRRDELTFLFIESSIRLNHYWCTLFDVTWFQKQAES